MDPHRIGIVWPEAVQPGHLAELELFVPQSLELDIEPAESAPELGPDGITLAHVERLPRDPGIGRAARRLARRGARAVAYGCTTGSYVLGPEGDAAIAADMRTASGVPATTTSAAAAAALRELEVRRVAVLSPHVDELNARLRTYLEASGFEVVNMVGLNQRGDIEAIEPTETRDLVATRVDTPAAEAIFISCTGLRTAAIIDELEAALSKPVVTANQATLWHVAQLAGAPTARSTASRPSAVSHTSVVSTPSAVASDSMTKSVDSVERCASEASTAVESSTTSPRPESLRHYIQRPGVNNSRETNTSRDQGETGDPRD